MVRPFKPKVPPIELSWSEVMAVNCVALLQVKSPEMAWTPFNWIVPLALWSIMTSPLYVWQLAIASASVELLIVIDGPLQFCAVSR